ncbi:MAG: hypothetical protein WAN46_21130 [Gammaproteobacteria bacterium]
MRRKVAGPIQSQSQGVPQGTVAIGDPFLVQPLEKRGEHGIDPTRLYPIEQGANRVVRWDLVNAKQALGIVLPLRFLQRSLL